VCVDVDAAPDLLPQASGLDVLDEERRRTVFLAQRPVQELEHRQTRVEADDVDELEWPHGVIESELERLVDVPRARHPLLEHEERLVADHRVDTGGDEAGRLAHDDGLLAHAPGDLPGEAQRVLGRLQPAHDLHQLHLGYRVEEVHPHDPLRPARGRRDLGHGKGRGVGGEHDRFGARLVQTGEHLELQIDPLWDRLDDEAGLRDRLLQIRLEPQALVGGVGFAGGELSAGAALVEVGADLSPRVFEGLGGDVVEEGAVAAGGSRVGDAPTHEPGADDGDGLDPHVVRCRMVARQASVPRAR
jgi:hypothetical protein